MSANGILGVSLMVIFGLNLVPAVGCIVIYSEKQPTVKDMLWFAVNCVTVGACLVAQAMR